MRPFVREGLAGRVVFGAGSLADLPAEVERLGARRPLLIAGATPEVGAQVAGLLPTAVAVWDDVRQHVPVALADRCHAFAQEQGADLLVSVGGGSATGLAKAVALRSGLPVLAVPTTYAGSEMTPIWGASEGGVKTTGRDPRVLPRTVLYDPELLLGLPAPVVGPSGMNALAHCVEGLYAPAADPLSSLAAVEGARLLVQRLPAAYATSDVEPRGDVLWASCLAGHVLGTVGASLHHSVCHLLGGLHDLPHAETHAVVLPHVVQLLLPAVAEQLAPLARVLDVAVAALPGALWDVGAAVGTPVGLRSLGLPEDALPGVVTALLARRPASPREIDERSATELVAAVHRGDRPA